VLRKKPNSGKIILFKTTNETEKREEPQMTLTIDLPPEMEERLQRQADSMGINASEYARELLKDALDEEDAANAEPMPTNGAELVAYWQRHGVIGSWANRTDIGDSVEYARKLRRQAETRSRD
jgi:hypothetical protein